MATQAERREKTQAAIVKANVLRNTMKREAERSLLSSNVPDQGFAACAATRSFRDHAIALANRINSKCLSEDKQTNLAVQLSASITEASSNVGLVCR